MSTIAKYWGPLSQHMHYSIETPKNGRRALIEIFQGPRASLYKRAEHGIELDIVQDIRSRNVAFVSCDAGIEAAATEFPGINLGRCIYRYFRARFSL